MTCILAVEDPHNHRAIVYVDSGSWSGDEVQIARQPKLWRSHGAIVSICGMRWMSQVARHVEFPQARPGLDSVEEYAATVIDNLSSRAQTARGLNPDQKSNMQCVVGYEEHVYVFGDDGGVSCVEVGTVSGGSGCDIVLGAALALRHVKSYTQVFELGRDAMLVAAEYVSGCRPPIQWMATDGTHGSFVPRDGR